MADPKTRPPSKAAPGQLGELLSAMVLEPIRAQQMLDREYAGTDDKGQAGQVDLFAAWAARYGSELAPILGQFAPARLRLDEFCLKSRVRVEVRREHGFAVRVLPLNAAYEILHQSTATRQTSIEIEVRQYPLNPSAASSPEPVRNSHVEIDE